VAGLTVAGTTHASPNFIPSGSNITFGHTSNTQTIHGFNNNPAMGATALKDGEGHFKWGLFDISAGLELGNMNNIEQTINDLSDAFGAGGTPTTQPEVDALVAKFNSDLQQLTQDGTIKISANVAALSPIVIAANWLGGALVFDFNATAATKIQTLYDPIDASVGLGQNDGDDVYFDGNNLIIEPTNDTAAVGSVIGIAEFSLGYSHLLSSHENGDIYGGIRLKALRVGLYREAVKLSDANGNVSDTVGDFSADDVQTAMTADLGALYTSKHYRFGATLKNINAPSFDYNTFDISKFNSGTSVYSELSNSQTYTMDRQLVVDAAWHSENRYWVINGSYDVNAVADPFGDEYKWMVVSAAYASDRILIPGIRFGVRKNLAGSHLSYLTLGTTLFNVVEIDAAASTQKVEVDGSSYPRAFFVSIGASINF